MFVYLVFVQARTKKQLSSSFIIYTVTDQYTDPSIILSFHFQLMHRKRSHEETGLTDLRLVPQGDTEDMEHLALLHFPSGALAEGFLEDPQLAKLQQERGRRELHCHTVCRSW